MNKLTFFSDTDCDIFYGDLEKYNINLIYMPVYIDGEEYKIDLKNNPNFDDFYAALNQKKMPTTAAINVQNYIDTWEPFLKEGNDIIYVAFSSALSATFEQMFLAIKQLKTKYPKQNIYYVDTRSISAGARRLVIQAAKLALEGKSATEIVKFVEEKSKNNTTMFIVEDLNHLKRGGRVSTTTAVFGGLLNFKPILHIDTDGKLSKLTAVQGFKKGIKFITDSFKEKYEDDGFEILIIHANNMPAAEILRDEIKSTVKAGTEIKISIIGPIVAAHCGLGTVGVIYNKKA